MLSNTKPQNTLLSFFAANPQRFFYLGDLQKKTKVRALPAQLSLLLKENILVSYSKKGKKYFRVNKKNNFFETSIAAGLRKKWKREDELLSYLKKFSNLKKVVLTGLFVGRGDMICDLLLVGAVSDQKLRGVEKHLEKMMGQEINYALFSVEEYNHRKSIFDRFMKDITENDHLVLFSKIRE